jgi:hypothetical protein
MYSTCLHNSGANAPATGIFRMLQHAFHRPASDNTLIIRKRGGGAECYYSRSFVKCNKIIQGQLYVSGAWRIAICLEEDVLRFFVQPVSGSLPAGRSTFLLSLFINKLNLLFYEVQVITAE